MKTSEQASNLDPFGSFLYQCQANCCPASCPRRQDPSRLWPWATVQIIGEVAKKAFNNVETRAGTFGDGVFGSGVYSPKYPCLRLGSNQATWFRPLPYTRFIHVPLDLIFSARYLNFATELKDFICDCYRIRKDSLYILYL